MHIKYEGGLNFPNSRSAKTTAGTRTLRREKFLESAAHLIGQQGYEAVTMTAVAEHAHASIGTLYDYFPDKHSLALALKTRYIEESDAHWQTVLADPLPRTKSALAELFVNSALAFAEQRPAYLPLLGAPIAYSRSPAAREPVRRIIANALQRISPKLSSDRALLGAQVMVQMIKGLLDAYRHASQKERLAIASEFRTLMNLYLSKMLK